MNRTLNVSILCVMFVAGATALLADTPAPGACCAATNKAAACCAGTCAQACCTASNACCAAACAKACCTAACAKACCTAANPAAAVVGKPQTTCPVMPSNPINKKLFVDADGKRIYVCCKGCLAAVQKDPKKYIQQLEAAGVTLEAAPAKP